MTVFHISGGDARLVSARLPDLVAELIGDGDRGSLFESHDLADTGADDKASVVSTAVMGVQTESLFGDKRVVVLRNIDDATVAWRSSPRANASRKTGSSDSSATIRSSSRSAASRRTVSRKLLPSRP